MLIAVTILTVWVLLNILFVLIVVPPRKPRRQPMGATTLSPAPIDPSRPNIEQDEPFSIRHVIVSVAMGAFFVLVPPLLALRDAITRLFGRSSRDG